MKDFDEESLFLHERLQGKINIQNKMHVRTSYDLSLVYSPGVAAPCLAIAENEEKVWDYTIKGNTIAIVSDGSAVLGLGNIGAKASIPVMEGKAMLFKRFANVDAFPICLDTQDTDEIVNTVRAIAPVFGGINLEDISAPRSFEIESRLQDLGIPVFHDDQHGTAIVVLAALVNSCKVLGKQIGKISVVVNGAGAAGIAIVKLLKTMNDLDSKQRADTYDIIMCDSKGIIHKDRDNLNDAKTEILEITNHNNKTGSLQDAIVGADVFIGVSMGNVLTTEDVKTMAKDSIIFALANPTPEIMPELAYAGGAAIVGTGRSDLPNQINNILAFPGIFRGALDAKAKRITLKMKIAAAKAIATFIRTPTREEVIPTSLNERVAWRVADAVKAVAEKTKW